MIKTDTNLRMLSIHVLIVDDYQAMRMTIRRMLVDQGFTSIFEARDGLEALVLLRGCPIDIVISDLVMERMDGLELLREIRGDANLAKLPFIMITATADRDRVIAAKAAGVTGYVVKPFTAAILKSKIASVLADVPKARQI
jgi:two-component system, chemotaxis family, chemotaxis protein CheY